MNKLFVISLKVLRKLFSRINGKSKPTFHCEKDADIASKAIYESLISNQACMIARFGANELNALCNYISINRQQKQFRNYIFGTSSPWWWESNIIKQLHSCAGFFPPNEKKIAQFCELMIKEIPQVDVLGSWLKEEGYFERELNNSKKIDLELLNPYFSKIPWTRALEGKKVLVVHPFSDTIKTQYKKRELLFKSNLLPKFELKTIKAVQSIAGENTNFEDWFEALNFMKAEIDKTDYDICLIGAGAYGFPLAAHVKRMGKKGFHLGGSLQLLFGIRGKRWEDASYNPTYNYAKLINEHWVKPSRDERPKNAEKVEGACYW